MLALQLVEIEILLLEGAAESRRDAGEAGTITRLGT